MCRHTALVRDCERCARRLDAQAVAFIKIGGVVVGLRFVVQRKVGLPDIGCEAEIRRPT